MKWVIVSWSSYAVSRRAKLSTCDRYLGSNRKSGGLPCCFYKSRSQHEPKSPDVAAMNYYSTAPYKTKRGWVYLKSLLCKSARPMDLKMLEDFLVLAEFGNFSKAAQLRHVTQPAFSRRIRALETWLGAPLIDRSSFPTTLTSEGAKFRDIARDVVRQLYEGREELRIEHRQHECVVEFAMPHSLAVTFFPGWWQRVATGLDRSCAKVVAGNYHDCVQLFVHGSCQFLVCFRHGAAPLALDPEEFPGHKVAEDVLVPVMRPDRDGSVAVTLPGTAASPVPLLGYASDAFLGRVVADLLARLGEDTHLSLCYESSFAAALRAEALAGTGLGWLPRSLVTADLESGSLTVVGNSGWQTRLEVWLYRSKRARRKLVERVWEAAMTASCHEPLSSAGHW